MHLENKRAMPALIWSGPEGSSHIVLCRVALFSTFIVPNFGFVVLFQDSDLPENKKENDSYLVFARKYRPLNFDTLIGQSHLVQTLSNAFDAGRIAHAYVLTGVRGVGKTTTARILAKGLNCTGEDGTLVEPTLKPCGVCSNCTSITDGKNIDVYEMDAASRTGINDIREIIESLPYKPLSCRYKVFIIDEVHMLSTAAFNGLLKTLEEPPAHVKFIFATTEIHKIPATILSRCQRIDLKRVDIETLRDHFAHICGLENVTFDDAALAQIARAADGSVRDGLSLLDQAVARGGGHISVDCLSDMLGSSQTDECLNIIESCLEYNAEKALELWNNFYKTGYDPKLFAKELLRHIEWIIRFKNAPQIAEDLSLSEELRQKGKACAEKVSMPILSRMWDIALKSISDMTIAPDPYAVCEVMIVRMVYGMKLPDPVALMQAAKYKSSNQTEAAEKKTLKSAKVQFSEPLKEITLDAPKRLSFNDYTELSYLLKERRSLTLKKSLEMDYVIEKYNIGEIHLSHVSGADPSLTPLQIAKELHHITQTEWQIYLSDNTSSGMTKREEIKNAKKKDMELMKDNKIVKAIFTYFPDAKMADIYNLNK